MEALLQRAVALHQTNPGVRLYAVVDGYQYEQHTGERLTHMPGVNAALFEGTEDETLAQAGPWLFEPLAAPSDEATRLAHTLDDLDKALPAMVWLLSDHTPAQLADELRLRLDATLPDGRQALLRWWDPRVMASLAQVLDSAQREHLFGLAIEWHFFHLGRRARIGRA